MAAEHSHERDVRMVPLYALYPASDATVAHFGRIDQTV